MEESRTSRVRLNKSESAVAGASALQRQEVLLAHVSQKTSSSRLVKGWVNLPCSDFLIWETAHEKEVKSRQKREFLLNSSTFSKNRVELLNGRRAFAVLSPESSQKITDSCVLGLKSSNETLIVVFKNSFTCSQWGVKLQECIGRRASSGMSANSLGNIFDITEIQGEGYWRDFKVTFVHGNWSCEEFMLFDSTQSDLQRSADEVMSALEGRLNEMNRLIMENYLRQLTEVEISKRKLQHPLPHFNHLQYAVSSKQSTANKKLLTIYKDLPSEDLLKQTHFYITAHHSNDLPVLAGAFNLIYLQSAAQTISINQLAVSQANKPEIKKIKQNLVSNYSQMSQMERHKLDKTAAHLARVKENSRLSNDPDVQSGAKDPRACGGRFFGEACDCRLF